MSQQKNTSKKLLAFSHLMLCAENTKHPSIPNFRERGGAVRWNWGESVHRHSFSVTYSTHVTRVVKDSELCLVTVHVAYKVWSTLTFGQVTTSLVENINVWPKPYLYLFRHFPPTPQISAHGGFKVTKFMKPWSFFSDGCWDILS